VSKRDELANEIFVKVYVSAFAGGQLTTDDSVRALARLSVAAADAFVDAMAASSRKAPAASEFRPCSSCTGTVSGHDAGCPERFS
jgi:hypothetical protein